MKNTFLSYVIAKDESTPKKQKQSKDEVQGSSNDSGIDNKDFKSKLFMIFSLF